MPSSVSVHLICSRVFCSKEIGKINPSYKMETLRNEVPQIRSRSFKTNFGPFRISFNPVVTIISGLIIWTFAIACMISPKTMSKESPNSSNYKWFYLGVQNIWILFLIYIFFSKYGKIKLGKDDDKPEFNNMTYFSMLFVVAVGVEFFYFAVAEPILHYQTYSPYGNRFWNR